MKGFATGSVLVLLAMGPLANLAHSQFKCGGDLLTYEVRSSENVPGTGVRCVKYYPLGATVMIWYGEGAWGAPGRPYRHIGIAFRGSQDAGIVGRAGDIVGNGEDWGASVTNLVFQLTPSDSPAPTAIIVTGTWKEQWTLRAEGVHYAPLGRPKTCGSNFVTYAVRSPAGTSGSGMRCILRMPGIGSTAPREGSPPYTTVWFGNGDWQGTTYSHVGRVSMSSSGSNSLAGTGEASDICDFRFGRFCGAAPQNSIQFFFKTVECNNPTPPPFRVPAFSGYGVGGAWNEEWHVTAPPCDL